MLELKKTPEHTIDRVFLLALLALFARNVVYSLLAAVVVFFFGALFLYPPYKLIDNFIIIGGA